MKDGNIIEPLINSISDSIIREYDAFVKRELDRLGFQFSEIMNGKYKAEKYIKPLDDEGELHQYFLDDVLVLQFKFIVKSKMSDDFSESSIQILFEPV